MLDEPDDEENGSHDNNIQEKVKTLVEMGFEEQACKEALQKHNGDADEALNTLLN